MLSVGFVAGMGILSAALFPGRVRKTFREQGTLELPVDYAFDETGFTSSCEIGTSNLKWKHLTDFLYDGRTLLLRRTPAMIYLIPANQLAAGEADTVVARLRDGGVKER